MEEKIIIESTHSKKINVICSAIIIVLYVVYCEAMYLSNDAWTTFGYWFVRRIFIPIIFLALIFFSTRTNICVTNMRVYGKAFWGKRVDLPLDSISAVAIGFGHSIGKSATLFSSFGTISNPGISIIPKFLISG